MAFKWPGDPSTRAEAHELADFVELVAWRDGRMSTIDLERHLSRLDEIDYSRGVQEEDELNPRAAAAFVELERRYDACAGSYPFDIDDNGQAVRLEPTRCRSTDAAIYMYLLLATRLDMNAERTHRGVDGTALFEELAAEAARAYLGGRSKSLVFGVAPGPSFAQKVDDLCRRIGEGDGFVDRDGSGPTAKDGKLDVVAWIPFLDCEPGKLLMFGQCKTGTNYRDHLPQLVPDAFFGAWCRSPPVVGPTRAFFIAEALPHLRRQGMARLAGILFDRCRIVDCAKAAGPDTLAKIAAWTAGAALANGLSAQGAS